MNNFDQLILDTFKSLLNNHYDKIKYFSKNILTYYFGEHKEYTITLSSIESKENKPISIDVKEFFIYPITTDNTIKSFILHLNGIDYFVNGLERVEFAQYLNQFEDILRRKELEMLELPLSQEPCSDPIDIA